MPSTPNVLQGVTPTPTIVYCSGDINVVPQNQSNKTGKIKLQTPITRPHVTTLPLITFHPPLLSGNDHDFDLPIKLLLSTPPSTRPQPPTNVGTSEQAVQASLPSSPSLPSHTPCGLNSFDSKLLPPPARYRAP
ncbi:unnamed protein product [Lactuca virosa]|uniref:Uncharacterized protein n=1 Tax=Lactuca virosa TaxID=75947 RepID=A0AAU9MWE7_9ASTR|nr:unnamed protein product [Lactuca virosa]